MLLAVSVLFVAGLALTVIEKNRGRRLVLSTARNSLDLMLIDQSERWSRWKQYFGASSFRLFLHYILHQLLGFFLYFVRKLEYALHRLRRHNRNVAEEVKSTRSENHLSHIAAHKASTALSTEEKEALRERVLND